MRSNLGANPRVNSPWRIRNDDKSIVVYKRVTDTVTHKVLTPIQATLLPFLDGSFTIQDIKEAWNDALAISSERNSPHSNLFQTTLSDLISTGFVSFEGETKPVLS